MTDLERALARPPAGEPAAAVGAFRERATAAGLVDVAYASLDSPFGELTVYITRHGLVRLAYPDEPIELVAEELARRLSPRIVIAPRQTDPVRRELAAYFASRQRAFSTPIDWSLVRGFTLGVLRATAAVPFGTLTTYREVAAEAGNLRAARAAGNALSSNPIPIVVPCHRVVHADGSLGGYTGGLDRKRFLLRLEGAWPEAAVRGAS